MREIEFRGKRKDTGEWVYGYYFKDVNFKDEHFIMNSSVDHEVIPETVGQFINITDDKDKKVFMDDIVKGREIICGSEAFYIGQVVQMGANFCVRYKTQGKFSHDVIYIQDLEGLEIIGSIHDNPELIDKEQSNE